MPEHNEISSSPPRTDMETEHDDLPDSDAHEGMKTSQTEPKTADPEVHVISSDVSSNLRQSELLPRFARELTSLTESFAGATQLISSSDPTPMSVDDDSAST